MNPAPPVTRVLTPSTRSFLAGDRHESFDDSLADALSCHPPTRSSRVIGTRVSMIRSLTLSHPIHTRGTLAAAVHPVGERRPRSAPRAQEKAVRPGRPD